MDAAKQELLPALLRECASRAPAYPGQLVQALQVTRERLDEALDQLRLSGLVRLTDWVQGQGQGYALTQAGTQILQSPRQMERLGRHGAPPPPASAPLRPERGRETAWERGEAIRQAFLYPDRPIVTQLLLAANIFMFMVGMVLAIAREVPLNLYLGSGTDRAVQEIYAETGSLSRAQVLAEGEWWRLLSYGFVHSGLLHLFLNMLFLSTLGPLLERLWGRVGFVGLYVSGLLGGGCAVMLAHQGAVGASGALCGLLAALILWLAANRSHLPSTLAATWMRVLMINAVLIAFLSMLPRVSAMGHLGGAIAGGVFTLPFLWYRYAAGWKRWLGMAGMAAVPVATISIAWFSADPHEVFLARYHQNLRDGEHVAVDTYKDHALPILRKDDLKSFYADDKAVRQAVSACKAASAKLDGIIDRMKTASTFDQQDLQEMARLSQEYFAAWRDFFDAFAALLQRRAEWNADQILNFSEQLQAIGKIKGSWRKALDNLLLDRT